MKLIKEEIIKEETLKDTVDKAEKVLDNPEVVQNKGQIESTLDRALKVNRREVKRGGKNFSNVLFIGEAGTGKTSRIKQWAADNNINLVLINASAMDDTDLGGVISKSDDGDTVKRLATTELDELEEENSVLFLDEFNRAPKSVRASLLTLIQDHIVRDDRVKGKARFLKNFLFTIAAINPADENYDTDVMDDAEVSRFKSTYVYSDPSNTKNYLVKLFTQQAKEADDEEEKLESLGKAKIAETLLGARTFKFDSKDDIRDSKDSGNGLILTARTLTNLLQYCDGTKEDFLANWNDFCNSLKRPMVERILANYKDVEDKANDAIKQDSESDVFKKHSSLSDRLRAANAARD